MPVLVYEGPELNSNQPKELIKGLTDVAFKVTPKIPIEVYYVFLREQPDDKIGVEGYILPEYIEKLQKMREK